MAGAQRLSRIQIEGQQINVQGVQSEAHSMAATDSEAQSVVEFQTVHYTA
jgi:hypothetical protein